MYFSDMSKTSILVLFLPIFSEYSQRIQICTNGMNNQINVYVNKLYVFFIYPKNSKFYWV